MGFFLIGKGSTGSCCKCGNDSWGQTKGSWLRFNPSRTSGGRQEYLRGQ